MGRTRKKMLVVEDRENWREILRGILEGEGYDVDVAENYPEALDKLERERFDLVTVDITLPDESDPTGMGKILLDRISSSGLEARTIVVTGWERVDVTAVRDFLKDYNAHDFFWKADFSPPRFRESVRTALEEQPRPEQIKEDPKMRRKVFLAHEYEEPWLERLYKELRGFLISKNHIAMHPLDAAPGGALWRRIATMIEEADLGFYDITTMNGNVCFELGYSIGARKPYFALVDTGSIDRENVPRILEGNWWVTYQAEADLREQVTRVLGSPLDDLGFFYESTEPVDSEAGTALLMVANEARQRSDIQPVLQRVLRGMGWQVDTIPIERRRDIPRLHRRILEHEIIIGDLASDDRLDSKYANAELALALGIACGAKKKPIILQEETCKILSDMKTLVREFRGKEEAKKALREEL